MKEHPTNVQASAKTLTVAHTLAGEVMAAIAGLEQPNLVGPWPETLKRRAARDPFKATITPETHSHKKFELAHLVSGRCAFSLGYKHYALRAGDLCFLRPDVPHCESHLAAPAAFRIGWWGLGPDDMYFTLSDFLPEEGFRAHCNVRLHKLGSDARDAMAALKRFGKTDDPPPVLGVKEALLTLAVQVLRNLTARVPHEDPHAHGEIISQIKQYIARNLDRPLPLAEVARAALLSPNYLTTLFRKETGVPLGTYIARERVGHAKDLLATTDKSVKEIGYALGFDDPYTFSRAFKRVEGLSPQQYRRKQG